MPSISTVQAIAIFQGTLTAIIYLSLTIVNPMAIYEGGIEKEVLDETPPAVLAAMKHMSFIVGYGMILQALIVICLVLSGFSPRLGMEIHFSYWAFHIVAHNLYPWPTIGDEPVAKVLGIPIGGGAWVTILIFTVTSVIGYSAAESKKRKKD